MTNKQISQASELIMKGAFPFHCVYRDQQDQNDVGIDYEIELLNENDQGTSFIFKVQLKGIQNSIFDKDGNLVFSKASVKHFSNYTRKLEIPLIFIITDIATKTCYWNYVQGNNQIENDLRSAGEKGQKNFTVRFPASNEIINDSTCRKEMMKYIEKASESISLRKINQLPMSNFPRHLRNGDSAAETVKKLQALLSVALSEDLRQLIRNQEFQAAEKKAQLLLDNEAELPETRIAAGISLVAAHAGATRGRITANRRLDLAKYKLNIALLLVPICRDVRCPKITRKYVITYTRCARMSHCSMITMALAISELTQEQTDDAWIQSLTRQNRIEISNQVAKDFIAVHRLIQRILNKGLFGLLPHAWIEWVQGVNSFIAAMRSLKKNDLADAYVSAVDGLFPYCIGAIDSIEDDPDAESLLVNSGNMFLLLSDLSNRESAESRLTYLETLMDKMKSSEFIESTRLGFRDTVSKLVESASTGGLKSMDDWREHFMIQASALGIDLDDPDDETAKIVGIGLKDLDPTRVSKNCKYIHIRLMGGGVPAKMLGLPTAGMKSVICLKHGHESGSLELDDAYEFFSKKMPFNSDGVHCESCSDTDPHQADWQWTHEWERDQATIFDEKFPRRGGFWQINH